MRPEPDDLATALAEKLALATDAASLAALGERIRDAYAGREQELRLVIDRTRARILREPPVVVRVALIVAAAMGGRGEGDDVDRALLAVVDGALDASPAATTPARPMTGTTLFDAIVLAMAEGHRAVSGLCIDPYAARESVVIRLLAWLEGWLAKLETERLRSADAALVARAWADAARLLLPHTDRAARSVAHAIGQLWSSEQQLRAWLSLLGAVMPGAVYTGDALFARQDGRVAALLATGSGLRHMRGAADLEQSLPEVHRAALRGAVAAWGIDLVDRRVDMYGDSGSATRVRDVLPGLDLEVTTSHYLGETSRIIELSRPSSGITVRAYDTPLHRVAVDRGGRAAWEQGTDYAGKTWSHRHLLGREEPPWLEHPPRAEVRLVNELLDEAEDGSQGFLFAEDVAPRLDLGVVLGPDVPRDVARTLAGRALPPDEDILGPVAVTDLETRYATVLLFYGKEAAVAPSLAALVVRALRRCERVIVVTTAKPIAARPSSVLVGTWYAARHRSRLPLGRELVEAAESAASDLQLDLQRGTYFQLDRAAGSGGIPVALEGEPIGAAGEAIGVTDRPTLDRRVLLFVFCTDRDGGPPAHGFASSSPSVRLLGLTIAVVARLPR